MSKLVAFKAAERALAMHYREFEEMKADPELKRELEFDAELAQLLAKYKVARSTLLAILVAESRGEKQAATKKNGATKQSFPLRTYKNPHTGKVIQIRLGTDSTYKGWVKEHGKETVESWKTAVEA